MAKIYAISDLHGNLPRIPRDAGLVLIAGDICPDFIAEKYIKNKIRVDKNHRKQARWLDTSFREWLESRPAGCEVVATWGNHDFVGERVSRYARLYSKQIHTHYL